MQTRRRWVYAMMLGPACLPLLAQRAAFWETKEPSAWSNEEKQVMLGQSPWAREGVVLMEFGKSKPTAGYGNDGRQSTGMTQTRPGMPAGGVNSVPIGEPVPRAPDPNARRPVKFGALARWESAKPVQLAGGPETPEMTGYYVIRLRGLPLMPPPKVKPGEEATNPNEALLEAIKAGSTLERKGKAAIPCDRLFAGSGEHATEVLLFFRHGADPITESDKLVTLESRFAQFHLSIKFPLAEMMYKGELAL